MKIDRPTEQFKNRGQYPKIGVDPDTFSTSFAVCNATAPAAKLFHWHRFGQPGRLIVKFAAAKCAAWRRRR